MLFGVLVYRPTIVHNDLIVLHEGRMAHLPSDLPLCVAAPELASLFRGHSNRWLAYFIAPTRALTGNAQGLPQASGVFYALLGHAPWRRRVDVSCITGDH